MQTQQPASEVKFSRQQLFPLLHKLKPKPSEEILEKRRSPRNVQITLQDADEGAERRQSQSIKEAEPSAEESAANLEKH